MYCSQDETMETQSADAAAVTSCLLDVMSVRLTEMDLYSARRVDDHHKRRLSPPCIVDEDIQFRGYHLRMDKNRPLKERLELSMLNQAIMSNVLHKLKYTEHIQSCPLNTRGETTTGRSINFVNYNYSYCSCL